MKILKRPDGLIFDTENPNSIEFNPGPAGYGLPAPLHEITNMKSDWEYLYDLFPKREGVPHPIFKDFGSSFFYCIEV